jgi:DNA invertase Pin-like site-specific DNA recombinase
LFGASAEFERSLIRERTMAGLKAARASDRKGGRPKRLTAKDLRTIKSLLKSGGVPIAIIAEQLGISRSTIYRHVGYSV